MQANIHSAAPAPAAAAASSAFPPSALAPSHQAVSLPPTTPSAVPPPAPGPATPLINPAQPTATSAPAMPTPEKVRPIHRSGQDSRQCLLPMQLMHFLHPARGEQQGLWNCCRNTHRATCMPESAAQDGCAAYLLLQSLAHSQY